MSPRTAALLIGTALMVMVTAAYVTYRVRDTQLRNTGAYALAMERVAVDGTIGEALGRPISRGLWLEAEQADYLTLRIPLKGTGSEGTLVLVSDVAGDDVEALLLEVEGEQTDLLAMDAVQLLSNSARESWSEGSDRIEAGEYAAAIKALDQAIELEETMANAWFLRGRAKLALGQKAAAEEDLHEAARLDPTDPEIPMLLGELFVGSKRYVECVTAYTSVLSIDAESSEAWYRRAICYERLRDKRRALAGAREACVAGLDEACTMQDRLNRR